MVEQTALSKAESWAATMATGMLDPRAFHWVEVTVAQRAVWTEQLKVALRVDPMASRSERARVEHLEPQTAELTVGQTAVCLAVSLVEPKVWKSADLKDVHSAATKVWNLAGLLVGRSDVKTDT